MLKEFVGIRKVSDESLGRDETPRHTSHKILILHKYLAIFLFLEKDLICLSSLDSLTKFSPLQDDLVLWKWMCTLDMNKFAILGGDKLLEMLRIRTATD